MSIQTAGSDYDTVLAVYDDGLVEIACNDDGGRGSSSRLELIASPGTYYVLVAGVGDESGTLQIQAYRATKEIKYADRAALQLTAYIRRLQQPNGLFFHGPEFHYHWGRGNGWVASSMAEVLKSLPHDRPGYDELMAGYKKMMAALLKYQSDNGMWRQLIDYEYS